MALDSAEFISELSILDPPGTDPLNQGDDHIRTTKKAVQQSFPNVGSAVPQTGVQMAQMAIKNEANTFTLVQTFQASLRAADQSASTPAYGFTADPTSGMFRATNKVGFAVGGVEKFAAGIGANNATVPFGAPDSSAAFPAYAFSADNTTGMFRNATGQLAFAHNGVEVASMASINFDLALSVRTRNGGAGAPSHSFTNDPLSGMYLEAVSTVGFSLAGIRVARIFSNSWQFFQQVLSAVGSEAAPGFSFTGFGGTGLYAAATSLNATVNGNLVLAITTSDMFAGAGHSFAGDGGQTVARPAFNFGNDADTGMFRGGANALSFGTGGVVGMELSSAQQLTVRKECTIQRNNDTQSRTGWRYTNAAGLPQWVIYLGASPNNTLAFQRYNSSGSFQDVPLSIRQANGLIRMSVLPTSASGLISGELWNNSGFVAVV